ncbi:MAG: acyl-CoA desaturase [Flavobacteriales bacterium]|nr:acyl-CoA desaturase [Flavobacteriales bacterium]
MKAPSVKFNFKDKPEFSKELRKRVDNHFKENNISKYGNLEMKVKSAVVLSCYFVPLAILLSGFATGFWPVTSLWILMGLGMYGIGLSVMHDANHSAYSKSVKVNRIFGFVMNLIGSYHVTWKIQHNVLHHTYTNIEGFDEDIENEVMRFSPYADHKKVYRFQAIYALFFYGLMTINRLFVKDFTQVRDYAKKNLLASQGVSYSKAIREVVFYKVSYIIVTLLLPLYIIDLPVWQTLIGFFLMHFICGIILALVFQSAHVIEETSYFESEDGGSVENNWAIHQLLTTANFGTKSGTLTWLLGGLNHQVEHHLFPDICHIHYTKISEIVQSTCKEYAVPYIEHKTFLAAIKSHFILLKKLGFKEIKAEISEL